MRVLVISQYYWPESFRINDLTEDLVRRGHQVTVLTGVPNYPSGSIFPEYANEPIVSFEDGLNENFKWFSNNWAKVQLSADFPVGMSSAVRK